MCAGPLPVNSQVGALYSQLQREGGSETRRPKITLSGSHKRDVMTCSEGGEKGVISSQVKISQGAKIADNFRGF